MIHTIITNCPQIEHRGIYEIIRQNKHVKSTAAAAAAAATEMV